MNEQAAKLEPRLVHQLVPGFLSLAGLNRNASLFIEPDAVRRVAFVGS